MKEEKGERRRQKLLEIAYRLFLEKGYDHTGIDEIIATAGISKGSYYYFPGKKATMEAVIEMMLNQKITQAKKIIAAPMPVPQKTAEVIIALRPHPDEEKIANAHHTKGNKLLQEKLHQRYMDQITPLLSEVVKEGISQGIYHCAPITEHVKNILFLSAQFFNHMDHTQDDIRNYIAQMETLLGAKPGTLSFFREMNR